MLCIDSEHDVARSYGEHQQGSHCDHLLRLLWKLVTDFNLKLADESNSMGISKPIRVTYWLTGPFG